MTIPWTYLNKRAAAISALKDYNSMRQIIDNYHDDSTEVRDFLTSPCAATPVRLGKQSNPRASENKVALTLDLIDVVKERYQQAIEYMAWFEPAWSSLSEEERYLLTEFFLNDNESRAEVTQRVGEQLGYEKTAVYNHRDKAISHLKLLLYGR